MTKIENRKSFFARLTGLSKGGHMLVESAYDFGKYAHRNQKRKTGERYFEHARAVALILIDEFGISEPRIICAALLHDVLEDQFLLTKERTQRLFGDDVAEWLDYLTKQKGIPYWERLSKAPQEVLAIKFADRIHNVRMMTLDLDEAWRKKYVAETEREFVKLGDRLNRLSTTLAKRAHALLADALNAEKDRQAAVRKGVHYVVYGQLWMESEAGWGQKPWGYTGHLSIDAMKAHNREYWATQPDGPAPEWYVRPEGSAFKCLVSAAEYQLIKASKNGASISDNPRTIDDSFAVGETVAIKKQAKA